MTALMSAHPEAKTTTSTGVDISYLTVGEQAILLKVMGLLKLDNSGMQTIKNAVDQKDSMFKILVAAGRRRKFIMSNVEMPICFEWYVDYLHNLGMKIPNYKTLSYQWMNLSRDGFTKEIDRIDAQIQLRKITLDGQVVEQKIGEAIIKAVVQPKVEPVIAEVTPRKERADETAPRVRSVNDEIIHQILVAKNYGTGNQGDAFITDLVNLYKNDSIVCKSILTGLTKNETCSQIFDRAEKRKSFSGKLTVLFYKYVDAIRSNKANQYTKIVTPKVTTSSVAPIMESTMRPVQVGVDSNKVLLIKGLIFDFLREAEAVAEVYVDVYTKPEFLRIIGALTKRKRYFFKAQALMIMDVIEKFSVDMDQDFLNCLECFAFYKKNLDENN